MIHATEINGVSIIDFNILNDEDVVSVFSSIFAIAVNKDDKIILETVMLMFSSVLTESINTKEAEKLLYKSRESLLRSESGESGLNTIDELKENIQNAINDGYEFCKLKLTPDGKVTSSFETSLYSEVLKHDKN